ncbi:unnamed protein product [Brugia timori]|uniref:Uncharacterized protein n=1 Tax=Brugia timori TaxID=42155 RepID=A0A0R3R152_9BILA|nr:unnamed protein product [Brugia timori]
MGIGKNKLPISMSSNHKSLTQYLCYHHIYTNIWISEFTRKTENAASDGEGCCRCSYAEGHKYADDSNDISRNSTGNNIHDSDGTATRQWKDSGKTITLSK